jgi:tetratricopeptide (TPR) repeat protein
MRRFLYISLALVLLAGLLGTSYFVVRNYRRTRRAEVLLKQADLAEEQGQLSEATAALGQYLSLVPTNTDARARYGLLLERQATTLQQRWAIIKLFDTVVLQDPERQDIRRRLAQLNIEVNRNPEALAHLQVLQAAFPHDGEVRYQKGRCYEALRKYGEATSAYEAAIRLGPAQLESYQQLANLLHDRLDKPNEAEEVVTSMVLANPQAYRAYLIRSACYGRWLDASLDLAAGDAASALRLAPDDAEVLVQAASIARAQGKLAEARGYLQHGLEKHPRHVRLYQVLASLEQASGQSAEALAVVRRGLKVLPDDSTLLWTLADLLLQKGDLTEAAEVQDQLRQGELPGAQLKFLQARLLVQQKHWLKASGTLEEAYSELTRWPELATQADLLLAQCYDHLGDPDRQLAAFRRAQVSDARQLAVCQGSAAALIKLGRLDEALTELEALLRLPRVPAAVGIEWAQLQVEIILRLPPALRDWTPVEQMLTQSAAALPDAVEVSRLRAEILAAKGQLEPARQLLEAACQKQPREVNLWVARAALAQREGKPAEATRLLAEARRQLGDRVELRLAHLRSLPAGPGPEAAAALADLAKGVEGFAPAEQFRLLLAFGHAALQHGDMAAARRYFERAAELQPDHLQTRFLLFGLAAETRDEAALAATRRAMERIEGPSGPHASYAAAWVLMRQARAGESEGLRQARAILLRLGTQQPKWAEVQRLLAEIAELERQPEEAINHYQRALDLGQRDRSLARRLLQLLYERQRYTHAEEVLHKLRQHDELTPELQRIATVVALANREPERALAQAQEAVPEAAKDYQDHLWLGQVFLAAGQKARAEQSLRRAVSLAEHLPAPWIALVRFYVQGGDRDKAEAVLHEVRGKLSKEQLLLVEGHGQEALGRWDRAEECFQEALKRQPRDRAALAEVGEFYLRAGQPHKAIAPLRTLLDPQLGADPVTVARTRRELARALADSGGYTAFREALDLLEQNEKKTGPNWEDQRTRAAVLATRPGHRSQALRLLHDLQKQANLTLGERMLLAQLRENEGQWSTARPEMLAVVVASGNSARYLNLYVTSLLRHQALDEAALWLEKLEQLEPQRFETFALQVRLRAARQQTKEAVDVLNQYIEAKTAEPSDPGARMLNAARLLDSLNQEGTALFDIDRAAEAMYRRYAAHVRQPTCDLVLARYLAQQGRLAEALDLCERASRALPPEPVARVLAVVLRAAPEDPQFRRAERWLTAALDKQPDAVELLLLLGSVRESQSRYADAEACYRKILALRPATAAALNNLAFLLAVEQTRTDEAQELIQQAIDVGGANAAFLDTRGVVHVMQGQPDQAIKDLEAAVAEAPTPGRYFHLAQAYLKANNRNAAVAALHKARASERMRSQLHPLERETYGKILSELGVALRTGRAG